MDANSTLLLIVIVLAIVAIITIIIVLNTIHSKRTKELKKIIDYKFYGGCYGRRIFCLDRAAVDNNKVGA